DGVGLLHVGEFQHGLNSLFGSGYVGHVRRTFRLSSLRRGNRGEEHRGNEKGTRERLSGQHPIPPVSEITAPGGLQSTGQSNILDAKIPASEARASTTVRLSTTAVFVISVLPQCLGGRACKRLRQP